MPLDHVRKLELDYEIRTIKLTDLLDLHVDRRQELVGLVLIALLNEAYPVIFILELVWSKLNRRLEKCVIAVLELIVLSNILNRLLSVGHVDLLVVQDECQL